MAISRVQTNTATGTGTSINVSFGVDVTAGNSIVVAAGSGNNTGNTMSVSDDQSNTYQTDESLTQPGGGDLRPTYIWSSHNVAGGATTVTVSQSSSAAFRGVTIIEYDPELEVDTNNNSDNSGADDTSHPHGSITTSDVETVVITAMSTRTDLGTTTVDSTGTWVKLQDEPRFVCAERNPTGTITQNPTHTSSNTTKSTCLVVAYKEVAAGGPTGPGIGSLALTGVGK